MEISQIINKAEKRFDFKSSDGTDEFVMLKIFPLRARQEINKSRLKGFDFDKVREVLNEKGVVDATMDNVIQVMTDPTFAGIIMNSDFDPEMTDYKMKICEFGLDAKNHSFTKNGSGITFDRNFFEMLASGDYQMFELIISEILKYQNEVSLGEKPGRK